MKITAPEEYGVRCLLRLARETDPLTIPEISAAEGLSQPYVGKLMAMLKAAGLVESERGRGGGYRLALPPEEITADMVMLALGEPFFNDNDFCDRFSGTETDGTCVHHGACGLRGLWSILEQCLRGVMRRITLADLSRQEMQVGELVRQHLMEVAQDIALPLVTIDTGSAPKTV